MTATDGRREEEKNGWEVMDEGTIKIKKKGGGGVVKKKKGGRE